MTEYNEIKNNNFKYERIEDNHFNKHKESETVKRLRYEQRLKETKKDAFAAKSSLLDDTKNQLAFTNGNSTTGKNYNNKPSFNQNTSKLKGFNFEIKSNLIEAKVEIKDIKKNNDLIKSEVEYDIIKGLKSSVNSSDIKNLNPTLINKNSNESWNQPFGSNYEYYQ